MNQEILERAGRLLHTRITTMGLNQTEFAAKCEVAPTDISRMVRGVISEPAFSTLIQIWTCAGATPNEVAEIYDVWHPVTVEIANYRLLRIQQIVDHLPLPDKDRLIGTMELLAMTAERDANSKAAV